MNESLPIEWLRMDGGTQTRAVVNDEVVKEYAELVMGGTRLPPVTVYYDGSRYWLADGFHRTRAHREAGHAEIEADVRQGTQRDAILHSVGANAEHGMRRTNEDKRRAVMKLLTDDHPDPETNWSRWNNREIARRARVDEKMVRRMREGETAADASAAQPQMGAVRLVRRGDQTYEQDTSAIGKRRVDATPEPTPGPKPYVFEEPEAEPDPEPPEPKVVDLCLDVNGESVKPSVLGTTFTDISLQRRPDGTVAIVIDWPEAHTARPYHLPPMSVDPLVDAIRALLVERLPAVLGMDANAFEASNMAGWSGYASP